MTYLSCCSLAPIMPSRAGCPPDCPDPASLISSSSSSASRSTPRSGGGRPRQGILDAPPHLLDVSLPVCVGLPGWSHDVTTTTLSQVLYYKPNRRAVPTCAPAVPAGPGPARRAPLAPPAAAGTRGPPAAPPPTRLPASASRGPTPPGRSGRHARSPRRSTCTGSYYYAFNYSCPALPLHFPDLASAPNRPAGLVPRPCPVRHPSVPPDRPPGQEPCQVVLSGHVPRPGRVRQRDGGNLCSLVFTMCTISVTTCQ